jgi:hypothetical protein
MLNFDPWNQMLQHYVDEQGRVNYAAWKEEAAGELQHWLSQLSSVNLQDYPDFNLMRVKFPAACGEALGLQC